MSGTSVLCLAPESQVWHQCKKLEIITVVVANYVWHKCFMSGTSDLCLTPVFYVWHQCKRRWKLLQYLSQIMSGTSDLCLPPIIYVWHQCWKSDRNIQGEMVLCKINRARLISCLAPMQEALEIITVLVANYVWHQCCKSGTRVASLALMQEAGNYFSTCRKLRLAPVIYVWHQH